MAILYIVIPFDADPGSDLDIGAREMKKKFDSIENHCLGKNINATIARVDIVHKQSEATCKDGDYVILFAHGDNEETDLCNNRGASISVEAAMEKLTAIGANKATRVLFMCCYSALTQHIAHVWKDAHQEQEVYGGERDIARLYSATRSQILTVCFALHELEPSPPRLPGQPR